VGGLMVIWLVPRVGAGWTLIPFTLIVGGAIATSWFLFSAHRMLVDVGFAVVAMLLLFTVLTYVGHAREQAGRRRIRTAFSRYLSPAMVEELAENPGRLRLGGETRTMSILFCDVRGFTAVAEAYKNDPERLTNLVNQILTPLTGVVLAHDGTVDKYIGDCIMAFWNAPLDDAAHARHACLAALEMQAAMAPLNERLAQDMAGETGASMSIGIGANSGTVVVGNMGSDQRFDYSVLGDAVNLSSRLEGLSKTYNVGIVVGENTRARAEELAFLELDWVRVKGRSEAVRIFTVVGDETVARGNAFRDLAEAHAHMLGAYRQRRWQEARTGLDACRRLTDGFSVGGLYDVYARRIKSYMSEPPPLDWDGVFDAVTK
ncbi:MAG: adenylate/guanylate cyclase domain-containing protein, partial [Rhodospirillales bacterium]|nr:adenylate/guanylate cyclase domain-containing protein [Rhodospirillales bacterium]